LLLAVDVGRELFDDRSESGGKEVRNEQILDEEVEEFLEVGSQCRREDVAVETVLLNFVPHWDSQKIKIEAVRKFWTLL
jgi:hypothetical protein